MKNYFKAKPTLKQIEKNKISGKSAERHFAALLTLALDARVVWTTRSEDDSKVDLITVMNHPWQSNSVDVLLVQVKSGPSFCSTKGNVLSLKKGKFNHLTKRNHNTLVCWTLVDSSTPYWFFVKANSTHFRRTYSSGDHSLNPLSRFDVIRVLTSANLKDGGKGIIFTRLNARLEYDSSQFKSLRVTAKAAYKKLKDSKIINPLFGEIEISRLGWRHITRESRLNRYKVASYEIIPLLIHILEKSPTKHYNLSTSYKHDREYDYRYAEYLWSMTIFDVWTKRVEK